MVGFAGLGTVLNVVAIILGTTIGVLIGHRLRKQTSDVVTDSLGLVTLVLGALNVVALSDDAFVDAVGGGGTLLVVLASLLVGGITGSLLRLEQRLEGFGAFLQSRFQRSGSSESKKKFIDGFVASSLIFTIGPLAILGALSDGLGQGIDQLALKSALDGFASIAFAASMRPRSAGKACTRPMLRSRRPRPIVAPSSAFSRSASSINCPKPITSLPTGSPRA